MKAMILAAGLGTRLKPFSEHTPKPLFTINQRQVLDITIEKLHRAGCTAIILNTHHHHQQIEAFVADQAYPVPVHLRHEPHILGTGGGIRNVADLWQNGPLLVINGDVVCDIDLSKIFTGHARYACDVTMVMHHHPEFNCVHVDEQDCVTGFGKASETAGTCRCLAFTGIHILERSVLDYLPAQGTSHIIDAYKLMLAAGRKIKAHVVQNHYWQDIGTPARYQSAVYDHMAPTAFACAFNAPAPQAITRHHLAGDGSDRQWYRLTAGSRHLIMVDHGICNTPGIQQEVDAYVDIGRHLHAQKAAVPQIYLWDRFAGLVFTEDLGDQHLQQVVHNQSADKRLNQYKQVIDAWLHMALAGSQNFDPGWTYQSARYDRVTILEKECRYFVEAFLQGYLGWSITYDALAAEFEGLADAAVRGGTNGLMHRDLQSRNIMVKGDRIFFIDFQGARPGPLQYDLASLLIDPYVALAPDLQTQLLAYCAHTLEQRYGVDAHGFLQGYAHCALTRNLQILGAFAFLSRVKKKSHFESHIPLAIQTLKRHLFAPETMELPKLARVVADAADAITPTLQGKQD
jgi:aminoglycoside/choline kinase family phosphotransferase/dTDP-glucose pyrophosphorylase